MAPKRRRAVPKSDTKKNKVVDKSVAKKARLDNEMPSGSDSMMSSPQVYAKDSMDRFGDDLCEVLLSYLSLKDRFITECVSKQWQRVVFTSVTDITEDIKRSQISEKSFELLLKKCQNITIDCEVHSIYTTKSMFNSLLKHCNQLNGIHIKFWGNNDIETHNKFSAKFAKQLKSIGFSTWSKVRGNSSMVWQLIETNLKSYTNLTKIALKYLPFNNYRNPLDLLIGNESQVLFTKLVKICFKFKGETKEYRKSFNTFVDNYKNQLKSIDVDIDGKSTGKSIALLMNGLSQMKALIELKIIFSNDFTLPYIHLKANQLKQIGLNCRQLKRLSLDLEIINKKNYFNKLFKTINENFVNIRRLAFYGMDRDFATSRGIQYNCRQLTHLTLRSHKSYYPNTNLLVNETSFINILHNLPKLQYLNINCIHLTDNLLNTLSKLPNIETIKLEGKQQYNQTTVDNVWINCPKLRQIVIKHMEVSTGWRCGTGVNSSRPFGKRKQLSS